MNRRHMAVFLLLFALFSGVIAVHAQGDAPPSLGCTDLLISLDVQVGDSFAVSCGPQECGGGSVWGTDVYTADSSPCRAAEHAGVIGEDGGDFVIHILPGQASYKGTLLNGIQTASWGDYDLSFEVVAGVPAPQITCVIDVSGTTQQLQDAQAAADAGDAATAQQLLSAAGDSLAGLVAQCAGDSLTPLTTVAIATSELGDLLFEHPAELLSADIEQGKLLTNQLDLLDYAFDSPEPPALVAGEIYAVAGLIDRFTFGMADLAPDASAMEYLEAFSQTSPDSIEVVSVEPLAGDLPGGILHLQPVDSNLAFIFGVVDVGSGSDGNLYGQVLIVVPNGEVAAAKQLAAQIVSSMDL